MSLLISNVSKAYKNGITKPKTTQALRSVSVSVNQGKIVALIGQNGAGKTTLIKCILNLVKFDSGTITFEDELIEDLIKKGQLGYMPEGINLPDMITLKEYIFDLMILRGLKLEEHMERLNCLIDRFYLIHHIEKKFSEYSKGTLKKAAFIQAMIHKPRLLILDEPTDGLDPVSRRALLNELLEVKNNKGLVIISTHILSDLEMIADEVIVLQEGNIVKHVLMKEISESLDDWYLKTILESGGMKNI